MVVGAVAVAAVATVATAAAVVANDTDIAPIANDVGHAWVTELVGAYRADEREIVGAWPGTISEARFRVLARVGRTVDKGVIDDIAKLARLVAQKEWHQISQPDPES
jgi:hypothetical protein